jgi:ABC transporter transmembrane region 2/ABC transporter
MGTWLAVKIGRPLVPLNVDRQRFEADFRFSLVRFCEDAEGVALYGGEQVELGIFQERFRSVFERPYLPLGTLASALLYPGRNSSVCPSARLIAVLEMVGLGALTAKLDRVENWSQRLSLGEQQRLAFARILLVEPALLFLDEATSALDERSRGAPLWPPVRSAVATDRVKRRPQKHAAQLPRTHLGCIRLYSSARTAATLPACLPRPTSDNRSSVCENCLSAKGFSDCLGKLLPYQT